MERFFAQLPGPGGKNAVADVIIHGPPMQIVVQQGTAAVNGALSVGLTGTIAASGTLTSTLFPTYGCKSFAFGGTLNQAGTLVLSRYIDQAGSISAGADVTQALVASTAGVMIVNDGLPVQSARIKFVNAAGSPAALTNFAGLLQAQ